jgi:glutamate synthase (ferredoxin)
MAVLIGVVALLLAVVVYDVTQRHHAILRNFPIIGHFRYLLEAVGPELRQYIVTDDDQERPFTRDERSWVYASAKRQNNLSGFGTDNAIDLSPSYLVIRHSMFPLSDVSAEEEKAGFPVPCAKLLGGWRDRRHAFRPGSVVNISAMSFGALGARAVEALNRGAASCGCLQNTGEGGISPYHRNGGELIWQIGTGYFGARTEEGGFSFERFHETLGKSPSVRAIEIKLSQGAKPGHGGVLPAAKVTPEIAEMRGVPMGKDVLSPPGHSAFHDIDSMIDFIERLADECGLPIGIKSAVGQEGFWPELAARMRARGEGPDFITIDGGEGGTGAAPLVFADHVALPFKQGMAHVYPHFVRAGLAEHVVFTGSGKLGFPERTMLAFALGCDTVNVAREAMMAIGCIQAKRCHTGRCPTGVTTHNRWLQRGLDPASKSERLARYVQALRKELLELTRACGVEHPAAVSLDFIDIVDGALGSRSGREVFGYEPGWGVTGPPESG